MEPVIVSVNLSGDLRGRIQAAAQAGFAGIEIFHADFEAAGLPASEVGRLIEQTGMRLVAYQPLHEFEAMPGPRRAEAFDRAERMLDRATELGAALLLVCSNVSPQALNDDARAAADLAELGERAGGRGLAIAYEAIAWGRRVRDYAHGWAIVRAADHPRVGLALDTFHLFHRADPLDALPAIPGERIFLVQANDGLRLDLEIRELSRHHRALPGEGFFPLAAFMRALGRTGFDGPLSLEVFSDVLRALPAARSAALSFRAWRWLIGQLPQR